ncbi:MAG: DUF4398 domain-containing protein [Methylotenera sp.]|nr:DUF4398 domain-containing protein [Oligoflexia bacterium]
MKFSLQIQTGAGSKSRSRSLFQIPKNPAKGPARTVMILALWMTLASCSLAVVRPQQDMSDTSAAIKAAREVNAETLSPDLYRQANEAFFRARNEYRLKNFDLAKSYAAKARGFAERAEFESMQSGAQRMSTATPDAPPPPPPEPYAYPAPVGTPANPALQGTPSAPSTTQTPGSPSAGPSVPGGAPGTGGTPNPGGPSSP